MAKYIDVTEAIKTAESMRKIAKAVGENVEAFEMLIQFLKDQDVVFQTPDESSDKGIRISNVVQNGSCSNSITISDKEVGKNLRTAYVNDGSEDCDFVPCITEEEEEADKLFGKANDKITGRYGNMYVATTIEGDKVAGTYGDKSVSISPPQCPECHSIFFDSNGICTRCGRSKLSK